MFIKELFEGKKPAELHEEFLKFGKGEFKNKYLIEAKKQKDKYTIKTSNEFTNSLVKKCLEHIHEKINVSGIIVSTFDLRQGMGGFVFNPEEEIKQFMGIKQLKVDGEIEPSKILEVMKKFPRAFYALSFSTENIELKIKPKAPKSAKPSTSEKGPSADFCSLKTANHELIKDLLFDAPSFNELKISHIIKVEDIRYPRDEKDPIKIRENSIRIGKITRILEIDGVKSEKEASFEG
jgi:hypothetical protein